MNALIHLIVNKNKFHDLKFKSAFIARLDGMRCKTSTELYNQLKKEFELPDYFGKNLDALYDCLMDLEWITKDHIVLVIEHSNFLLSEEQKDPELLEDFIITLNDVCESWDLMDSDEFTPKKMNVYIDHSDKIKEILETNEIQHEEI